MSLPSSRHLLVDLAPNLINSDRTGVQLLLTDLQVALTFLDGKDTNRDVATVLTIQRHARRTYDEVVGLLPHLTISDARRRELQVQISVLKARLVQLGQDF